MRTSGVLLYATLLFWNKLHGVTRPGKRFGSQQLVRPDLASTVDDNFSMQLIHARNYMRAMRQEEPNLSYHETCILQESSKRI